MRSSRATHPLFPCPWLLPGGGALPLTCWSGWFKSAAPAAERERGERRKSFGAPAKEREERACSQLEAERQDTRRGRYSDDGLQAHALLSYVGSSLRSRPLALSPLRDRFEFKSSARLLEKARACKASDPKPHRACVHNKSHTLIVRSIGGGRELELIREWK